MGLPGFEPFGDVAQPVPNGFTSEQDAEPEAANRRRKIKFVMPVPARLGATSPKCQRQGRYASVVVSGKRIGAQAAPAVAHS